MRGCTDRLFYGFQTSPMANSTPVDFSQFPAGATTTLFDEVPVETVSLSTGDMDLPIRYLESSSISAFFNADRAAVEAALVGTPFQLASGSGTRAVIGLSFLEYRECSIGPYIEAGIVIPVVRIGDPLPADWFLDMIQPPLDRKAGFYVLHIPATSEVAVAAGIEIWGFPKILTNIDFSYADGTFSGTIHDPGSSDTILTFSGTVGTGIPAPESSILTLSEVNGAPLKTINHVTGTAANYLTHDLLLTIGASVNPMAQNLRDFGVDGTSPTMITISTDYQSILYFGSLM